MHVPSSVRGVFKTVWIIKEPDKINEVPISEVPLYSSTFSEMQYTYIHVLDPDDSPTCDEKLKSKIKLKSLEVQYFSLSVS